MTTLEQSPFSMHTAAQIILALTSLAIGFKLGSSSYSHPDPQFPPPILDLPPPSESAIQKAASEDLDKEKEDGVNDIDDADQDSGVTEEEEADGDLAAVEPGVWEPCKLVLIVRTDLNMSPGDVAAQCSDATLACYRVLSRKNPLLVRHWEITGQAKIALKGTSEEQLVELEAIAKSLNLCARAVHNEELTKDKEGTLTVLAIGPAPVDLVNKVTGKLRLL
ncbi:hypothetical protein ACEPAF_3284 [Sanghuangporus sanghuang]